MKRARRYLSHGALVGGLVCGLLWIGSDWWYADYTWDGGRHCVGVGKGVVRASVSKYGDAGVWPPLTWGAYKPVEREPEFSWWFNWLYGPRYKAVAIPLWAPAILCLSAAGWLRSRKVGLDSRTCARCGYDRHGLATANSCPECGTSPPGHTLKA